MHKRIMFLRDVNYKPCGCIAITVNRGNNTAQFQVSVLNPIDRFDRKVARQLALGRMLEVPITVSIPANASMHDITEAVMAHIFDNKTKFPARAVKGAKLWLHYNGRSLSSSFEWTPSKEDLDVWQDVFKEAKADKDFFIVTHPGLRVEHR